MTALTCAIASKIVADALAEGRKRGFARLTAAVLDPGGHLVALARDDGSSLLRPQIAIGKAFGVLGMGWGGRELAKRAAAMPVFVPALIEMSGGRYVPVAGGVIIRDSAGAILGSMGVTGDTSDNDELAAVTAITAAGLVADTGAVA